MPHYTYQQLFPSTTLRSFLNASLIFISPKFFVIIWALIVAKLKAGLMLCSFYILQNPDSARWVCTDHSLFRPTSPRFSHDSPPTTTCSSSQSPFGFHLFSFLPSQTMAAPHRAANDPAAAQSGLSIPSALEAFVAEGDGLEGLDDIVDEDIAACTVSFALRRPGRIANS